MATRAQLFVPRCSRHTCMASFEVLLAVSGSLLVVVAGCSCCRCLMLCGVCGVCGVCVWWCVCLCCVTHHTCRALDMTPFQGRLLHLLPAKRKPGEDVDDKADKEVRRRHTQTHHPGVWAVQCCQQPPNTRLCCRRSAGNARWCVARATCKQNHIHA